MPPGPRELLRGAGHMDLYDRPQFVGRAVEKLSQFFDGNLALQIIDHRRGVSRTAHHSSSGKKQMLRKTSLVLAIAAALMLPSATFGKGGGPRGGYHGRYYGHGVWGHCWPGGWWRYGGWSGYGCWQWTPDGSICWICG